MYSRAVTPHTFFGILAQGLATWDNPPFVASAGLPKERERDTPARHYTARPLLCPKKTTINCEMLRSQEEEEEETALVEVM